MRTIYRSNDAYGVEASPVGVRILFKKRIPLPVLDPNAARFLAKMIVMAAQESERHARKDPDAKNRAFPFKDGTV